MNVAFPPRPSLEPAASIVPAEHPNHPQFAEALSVLQSTLTFVVVPSIDGWGFRFEHYPSVDRLRAEVLRMTEVLGREVLGSGDFAPPEIAQSWVPAANALRDEVLADMRSDALSQLETIARMVEGAGDSDASARAADAVTRGDDAASVSEIGREVVYVRSLLHAANV